MVIYQKLLLNQPDAQRAGGIVTWGPFRSLFGSSYFIVVIYDANCRYLRLVVIYDLSLSTLVVIYDAVVIYDDARMAAPGVTWYTCHGDGRLTCAGCHKDMITMFFTGAITKGFF